MTDRELLELAAKAAGIDLVELSRQYKDDWVDIWNPLTNDGDALRLAVKLDLTIKLLGMNVIVGAQMPGYATNAVSEALPLVDKCAATRRAIVRAAAEIGKMKGGES